MLDNNILVGATIGTIGGLFLLSTSPSPSTPKPTILPRSKSKQRYTYLHDAYGPLWHQREVNGFLHQYKVNKFTPKVLDSGTALAYTTGIYYNESTTIRAKASAEILMFITNDKNGVDITEGDDFYKDLGPKIRPNFDPYHTKPGWYCCPNGIPLVKLKLPIKSGITYTKRLVERPNPLFQTLPS